ncbi:MAG TPA: hypothetical protein VLK88_07310 [Gemmatimonadales bacterium]|nr:hypothetical protein [Gemmatimonadales bacterium]
MRAAFIAVSALSLSLISRPVVAQTQGPGPIGPSVQNLQAAAMLRPVAATPETSTNLATMSPRSRGRDRTGKALMIAGAAALVTGLIIEEDVVTIAGAVAAGVGLFLYLK